jgi:flagellar motor switch protein FliN/FliY
MSDGALSQAEIDALLSGTSVGPTPSSGGNSASIDTATLGNFLAGTVDALSSNLSMMTGGTVTFYGPAVSVTNRDEFLGKLPDLVTVVKADFTSGFPGDHAFIMGEETAKAIASLMNKEDNIELDDMAMSVLGEVVSQVSGSQITALTQSTGNRSIASKPPQAANVPKATAALPAGNFVSALYSLDLGNGIRQQLWEVYGENVCLDICAALKATTASMAKPAPSSPGGGFGAGAFGGMQGGMPQHGTNVQQIQYPNLMSQNGAHEPGNIGLLMDVLMEMTVELGRTKKSIKEILSMGEGTIIELDKLAGEPVDILVNHKLIAKGEVVVIDENFGVRVTEIISPIEHMSVSG